MRKEYRTYWKDPMFRKLCLMDAIGIAIISSVAGAVVGFLIGINL